MGFFPTVTGDGVSVTGYGVSVTGDGVSVTGDGVFVAGDGVSLTGDGVSVTGMASPLADRFSGVPWSGPWFTSFPVSWFPAPAFGLLPPPGFFWGIASQASPDLPVPQHLLLAYKLSLSEFLFT